MCNGTKHAAEKCGAGPHICGIVCLQNPFERVRLNMEALHLLVPPPKPLPLNRGELPDQWGIAVDQARENIAWTLQTLSPNALELSALWQVFQSKLLVDVASDAFLSQVCVASISRAIAYVRTHSDTVSPKVSPLLSPALLSFHAEPDGHGEIPGVPDGHVRAQQGGAVDGVGAQIGRGVPSHAAAVH
jgi:hypothetical protein